MESDSSKVDGASGQDAFADRDLGGADGGGNRPVAEKRADENPLAYRDRGENGKRRALYIERWIIDHGFGGDVRRFDTEAGVDFDA